MAEDVKADELVDQLRDSFNQKLRDEIKDLPAHQALQIADALALVQLDVFAGLRVRYRQGAKVDADAIAESWRRGLSINEVCQLHAVSRSVAYYHHPNKKARRAKAG
jgi:hypothetical protein